jgi:hypothetical protein
MSVYRTSGPQGKVEPYTVINDEAAWYAEDMCSQTQLWTYDLTPEDIQELDAAVAAVEKDPQLEVEVRQALQVTLVQTCLLPLAIQLCRCWK